MMGSNVSDTKLKPATKKPATRKVAPHAPELTKDDVYHLLGVGIIKMHTLAPTGN